MNLAGGNRAQIRALLQLLMCKQNTAVGLYSRGSKYLLLFFIYFLSQIQPCAMLPWSYSIGTPNINVSWDYGKQTVTLRQLYILYAGRLGHHINPSDAETKNIPIQPNWEARLYLS